MFVPGTLPETTDTGQRKLPGLVKSSLAGEEGVSRDVDLLAVWCDDDLGMCGDVGKPQSHNRPCMTGKGASSEETKSS